MANPQKLITIEAISDKADKPKFSIKGADGKWYSQFKQWQGEDNPAYSQLKHGNHNEPFKKGDQALITYKLSEYNGETQYNIVSIFPGDTARPVEQEIDTTKKYAEYTPKNDAFGKRLALHGMVNGILASGVKPSLITKETLQELVLLEDLIDSVLNPNTQDDLNVEDIPF